MDIIQGIKDFVSGVEIGKGMYNCDSMVHIKKDTLRRQDIYNIMDDLRIVMDTFTDPVLIRDWEETDEIISVPRAYGYEKFREELNDNTSLGEDAEFEFQEDVQQSAIDQLGEEVEYLAKKQDKAVMALFKHIFPKQDIIKGGIVKGDCGIGKTYLMTKILSGNNRYEGLPHKTLVICHESSLMGQTEKVFRDCLGLEDDDIGYIQGKTCHWQHKKVVFAMVQTLIRKDLDSVFWQKILSSFGVVMWDEVHHAGAEKFSQVIKSIPAKYRLGFTATPDADHWDVTENHWGGVIVNIPRTDKAVEDKVSNFFSKFTKDVITISAGEASVETQVYLVSTDVVPHPGDMSDLYSDYSGRPNFSAITNYLAVHRDRNLVINDYVNRAVKEGRCPLLLSGRVSQLMIQCCLFMIDQLSPRHDTSALEEFIDDIIQEERDGKLDPSKRRRVFQKEFDRIYNEHIDKCEKTAAIYAGRMSEEDLKNAKKADALFAIHQKGFEGFSDPKRDTLLLGTPDRTNLKQAVGRVQRAYPTKKFAVVLLFVDVKMHCVDPMGEKIPICLQLASKSVKSLMRCGCIIYGLSNHKIQGESNIKKAVKLFYSKFLSMFNS